MSMFAEFRNFNINKGKNMSDLQTIAHISAKSVIPEGEKWMRVIATAPTLDRDGEVIDTASLHVPIKPRGWKYARDLTPDDVIDLPFLYDHEWSVEKQLGSVRSMFINAEGELETVTGFTSLQRGVEAHTLAKEGHLGNSFSGTFDYSTGYISDGVIYDAEIIELSMVFKGSNRDARILEVSKSAKKERTMAEATEQTLEEKKLAFKALEDEIKTLEGVEAENVEEVVAEAEEVAEVESKEEVEVVAEVEAPVVEAEAVEVVAEPTKSIKKETKMSETIAVKQVQDAPVVEIVEKSPKATKKDIRELFVKQFIAYKTHNVEALKDLNAKAMELDGASKAIGYTDASALYQSEVVAADILAEYVNVGRVGALVNKIDILGATQWKQVVQTAGAGFRPVGIEETKEEDKPVWTPITVLPKEHALIVAWYDAIARETPIAVYNQIIRYIADEYAKLEDKIVLSFAGATTAGGDTFAATGLIPLLLADGTRTINVTTFSAADTQAGLGRAYGAVETDKQLTIVANRKTWGRVATTVDADGRNVFTVVGQQVSAGALGTFNVVISEEVTDGVLVMGAFDDYQLVTRGGMETLFSREATVGSLNLFTDDASAVRANVDIAGKPVRIKSFVLVDFVPVVS